MVNSGAENIGQRNGDKGIGTVEGSRHRFFSFLCLFLRDLGTVRETSERNGASHRFCLVRIGRNTGG